MNLLVVVQARTGSSRLPNKVLKPLAGKPLLQRQIERILAVTTPFRLAVATTTASEDDSVSDLCRGLGIACYRGHPTDLLDRHYQTAKHEQADVVVKIPSDCPLIDPHIISKVLNVWAENETAYDYLSNLHPASYPDGNDVEVIQFSVLETAWKEAKKDFEREHTTPFIWERPGRFRIGNVIWETGLNYSMTHRWTIDYPEDYLFAKRVYDELWTPSRPIFGMNDILRLLERKPEIHEINAMHAGLNWYRHHSAELRTISDSELRRKTPSG